MFLSNTNHEEDQPVPLKVKDRGLQKTSELDNYAELEHCSRLAGVYEPIEDGSGAERSARRNQFNARNCVRCKTCDIKDPNGNITWVPPARRRRTRLRNDATRAATT